MKNYTLATIAASAFAALAIGLAAPAAAAPSGVDNQQDTVSSVQGGHHYPQKGKTAYGTYQNRDKDGGADR